MNKNIKYYIILMSIVFLFSGCNLVDPVSIEERVARFVDDCNSTDKSDMYLNLHPDATSWAQRKASGTWSEFDVAQKPWSITITDKSGSTVTGEIDNKGLAGSTETVIIEMKEGEKDVWYIRTFYWADYVNTPDPPGLTIN